MEQEQKTRNLKLSSKIMIGLLFFGLLILGAAVVIGSITFRNDTQKLYNDMAYNIAEEAENLFHEGELAAYAEFVTSYAHGELSEEAIEAVRSDPRYIELCQELNDLRRSMEANDIYVSVMDRDAVVNAGDAERIRGIIYIKLSAGPCRGVQRLLCPDRSGDCGYRPPLR